MGTKRLKVKEAATQFGLSSAELYSGLKSGKYPGFRVGGSNRMWLIDPELLQIRLDELAKQNVSVDEAVIFKGNRRDDIPARVPKWNPESEQQKSVIPEEGNSHHTLHSYCICRDVGREVVADIDQQGRIRIRWRSGFVELSNEDIQVIAHLSMTQRAEYLLQSK